LINQKKISNFFFIHLSLSVSEGRKKKVICCCVVAIFLGKEISICDELLPLAAADGQLNTFFQCVFSAISVLRQSDSSEVKCSFKLSNAKFNIINYIILLFRWLSVGSFAYVDGITPELATGFSFQVESRRNYQNNKKVKI